MAVFTTTPALKKQWMKMEKKEQSFLEKQYESGTGAINDIVEAHIPDTLQETLDTGFFKAFELVFEKGTGIIEKTYSKERHQINYRLNETTDDREQSPRSAGAFSRSSGASRMKNVAIAGVEGIGLGILGIGLPDIPLFTAMILKGVYETALSYGCSYDTEEERIFILKLIQAAMSHGDSLVEQDRAINRSIHSGTPFDTSLEDQIRATSDALSLEMIYMKFIQTFPVAGVVGGAYDVIIMNRVTAYADIKYSRRFLYNKIKNQKKQLP